MPARQKVVFQAAQKFADRESQTTKPRVKVAPHADRFDEDDPGGWCAWPCRASTDEQSEDTAPVRSEAAADTAR
jgi:hypothetical protein